MTRSAKALWLVLLLNGAMMAGVVAYALGNVPFQAYGEVLKWFGLGALLSAVALALANMGGMDTRGETDSLEDAPPRVVRIAIGVVGCGILAAGVLVKGLLSTVSLLGN